MTRSAAPLIGVVATLAIVFQNAGSLLAFTWAAIHGAGVASVVAFLPAALGVAALWAGYFFLKRRNIRLRTLVFSMYAMGLVLVNEALLATPLKEWRSGRAIEAVEVRSVRDELLLSARGNPIGIRITFEAVVPQTGDYSISASALGRVGADVLWPLDFGRSHRRATQPVPSPGESPYDRFEKGVVYTFTSDMTPSFLAYDERAQLPCLVDVRTKYISEADVLSALSKSRTMKYRGEVHAGNAFVPTFAVVKEFVTSRDYDVEAMYRTIAIEGNRRCGSGE